MSLDTDVTLEDIARLCDVFYIGGTKVGALFGEAVVFTKKNAPRQFVTLITGDFDNNTTVQLYTFLATFNDTVMC